MAGRNRLRIRIRIRMILLRLAMTRRRNFHQPYRILEHTPATRPVTLHLPSEGRAP